MKYHYEYEVWIYNPNLGSLFLGRVRSYAKACACVMCEKLGFFNIRKVRVYE